MGNLSREMNKNNKIEIPEVKSGMFEMKYLLDGLKHRFRDERKK